MHRYRKYGLDKKNNGGEKDKIENGEILDENKIIQENFGSKEKNK